MHADARRSESSGEYALVQTPDGLFGLLAIDGAVAGTFLPMPAREAKAYVSRRWPGAARNDDVLPALQAAIVKYFDGQRVSFRARLHLNGATAFGRNVLEACARIPYGKTATYQDLARAAGSPSASRAVGSLMASNRCPLIIPCHRVIRSDGTLGGFSSPEGVSQKKRLLRMEGVSETLPLFGMTA